MDRLEATPALPPMPGSKAGRAALRALLSQGNILSALEQIHQHMGDVFRIPLPGFNPTFLVGPQANHFVTVSGRDDLRWRPEGDPVARLLRQGVLVTDGELHDHLRRSMLPALHKRMLGSYTGIILRRTDQVTGAWQSGDQRDMLVEMRRLALLVLLDALYQVDFTPELDRLWTAVLRTLTYISPGLWVIWPGVPRPGYRRALQQMDSYLYQIITARRSSGRPGDDLLGLLIEAGMDDDLIRDQLLTMLIAGHDTSTALLSWTLYLLGEHPLAMQRVQDEIRSLIGMQPPTIDSIQKFSYLEQVIQEALRLYPPIHIGNRIAAVDLEFQGYHIPAGTRVVYSIYLSHRHPAYWSDPHSFRPERFSPQSASQRPHYLYVPFGGGPRNCIGMAFAQVEVKLILARLLQNFELTRTEERVRPHMGATLEPRPGVKMVVKRCI